MVEKVSPGAEREPLDASGTAARSGDGPGATAPLLLSLQQGAGNRAVSGLVQRQAEDGDKVGRGEARFPLGALERTGVGMPSGRPQAGGSGLAVQRNGETATAAKPAVAADPVVEALKARIEKALTGKVTLSKLQKAYLASTYPQRAAITADAALMAKIKAALPVADWLRAIADLGMYAPGGSVAHASAKTADEKIRSDLGDYVSKAVKAGRSAQGQVVVLTGQDWLDAYYHEFPHEAPHGGPKDEEAKTNAFTTTRPPKNVIVLNKDKGNPGTTIHEGLHLYQNNALMSELGSPLNEGVTELFTRKVTTSMRIDRRNYEDNYQAAVVLQQAVGERVLAEAYFDGKVSGLKKAFVNFRVGKGDKKSAAGAKWTEFVSHFRKKEFDKAKDLCK